MKPGTKLSKFDGGGWVDASKYQSLVGSLYYLTSTRLDLLLIKHWNSKSVYGGTELHTLESTEKDIEVCEGNSITQLTNRVLE